MFTDRFIKVPSKVFSKKMEELSVKEDGEPAMVMILPFEISEYFKTCDDDDIEGTQIIMKNGETIMVYLLIHEFEKLLNEHQATN